MAASDRRPLRDVDVPALGAHALAFHRDGVASSELAIPPIDTQVAGSTLLACVGRGIATAQSMPTDNKGSAFRQVGDARRYTLWPQSGTALYACEKAVGGVGHVIAVRKPVPADETTLSVVEVTHGGRIVDVAWNEVPAGGPATSRGVRTHGPAVLVAWWWGDADVRLGKTAEPDQGFAVIDAVLFEGALVQCAVAVRKVHEAGTYRVTWTSTPRQGAQLWIIAVESSA